MCPHHRLIEPQLLCQGIPTDGCAFLEGLIEVVPDECAGGTRIGAGTEGQEKKWGAES